MYRKYLERRLHTEDIKVSVKMLDLHTCMIQMCCKDMLMYTILWTDYSHMGFLSSFLCYSNICHKSLTIVPQSKCKCKPICAFN